MNDHNFLVRVAIGAGLVKRTAPALRMQTVNEPAAVAGADAPAPTVRRSTGFQTSAASSQLNVPVKRANASVARPNAESQPRLQAGQSDKASEGTNRGGEDIHTVIPAAAQLNGDLQIEESIVLQCVVRGNVTQEGDHQVVLTETGGIHGTLRASTAVIGGTIEGDVYADRLVILSTGVVNGNIEYTTIAMKEGASVNGMLTCVVPNVLGESDGASAAMLRPESAGLRAVPHSAEERVA